MQEFQSKLHCHSEFNIRAKMNTVFLMLGDIYYKSYYGISNVNKKNTTTTSHTDNHIFT